MTKAYLLDIEGTTTPLSFVHQTLFPFARRELADFLRRRGDNPVMDADLAILDEEYQEDQAQGNGPPPWPSRPGREGAASYLVWLMHGDRKSRGLKTIQGRIWEEGYRAGKLKGQIYPDVEPAMRRWKAAGQTIAIFSSGSVLAQQLIFGHLPEGDLTGLIDAYFDTEVGSKLEPASYTTIAARLGMEPGEIVFLSDIERELDAASAAGLVTHQVIREGQAETGHAPITSFEGLE